MPLPPIKIPSTGDRSATEQRAGYFCSECSQTTFEPYAHKFEGAWHIPSSKGGFYELLQNELGGWSCSCAAWQYRQRCWHTMGDETRKGVYELDYEETQKQKRWEQASSVGKVRLEDLFPA